jgi:hypothetical protein
MQWCTCATGSRKMPRPRKVRTKLKSKAKNQELHARRRFEQRTGVVFSSKVNEELVGQIHRHEAVFIERSSKRVTLWWVRAGEKWLPVVYDKHTKKIVTVLPRVDPRCQNPPSSPD